MEQLLGPDLSEVLADLETPFTEHARLGKALDESADAVHTVDWLRDHFCADVSHLVRVLCEISGEAGLVAA